MSLYDPSQSSSSSSSSSSTAWNDAIIIDDEDEQLQHALIADYGDNEATINWTYNLNLGRDRMLVNPLEKYAYDHSAHDPSSLVSSTHRLGSLFKRITSADVIALIYSFLPFYQVLLFDIIYCSPPPLVPPSLRKSVYDQFDNATRISALYELYYNHRVPSYALSTYLDIYAPHTAAAFHILAPILRIESKTKMVDRALFSPFHKIIASTPMFASLLDLTFVLHGGRVCSVGFPTLSEAGASFSRHMEHIGIQYIMPRWMLTPHHNLTRSVHNYADWSERVNFYSHCNHVYDNHNTGTFLDPIDTMVECRLSDMNELFGSVLPVDAVNMLRGNGVFQMVPRVTLSNTSRCSARYFHYMPQHPCTHNTLFRLMGLFNGYRRYYYDNRDSYYYIPTQPEPSFARFQPALSCINMLAYLEAQYKLNNQYRVGILELVGDVSDTRYILNDLPATITQQLVVHVNTPFTCCAHSAHGLVHAIVSYSFSSLIKAGVESLYIVDHGIEALDSRFYGAVGMIARPGLQVFISRRNDQFNRPAGYYCDNKQAYIQTGMSDLELDANKTGLYVMPGDDVFIPLGGLYKKCKEREITFSRSIMPTYESFRLPSFTKHLMNMVTSFQKQHTWLSTVLIRPASVHLPFNKVSVECFVRYLEGITGNAENNEFLQENKDMLPEVKTFYDAMQMYKHPLIMMVRMMRLFKRSQLI